MRIEIKVSARSSRSLVKEEAGKIKVYVTAPAVDGRANEAVIEVLAEHFKIKKRQIEIIKGLKSRDKTISIDNL